MEGELATEGVGLHDTYRNSDTPPIESLLVPSSNAYENEPFHNISMDEAAQSHPKVRRIGKTNFSIDTAESHIDSNYKRRKLSMSPPTCQYRVHR